MAILDQYGKEISSLKAPRQSLATVAVRDKWSTYPANGLTPQRLAAILRDADNGDVSQQAELFSQMEERDGHLGSIFQTRKLAISGLEWKIEPYSDDARDVEIAERFREVWNELDTDELLLDLMDAVSKGTAHVALTWAVKDGGFTVASSEILEAKHWRFDLDTRQFYLMTEEHPLGLLPQFGQVIEHRYKARSGLPTKAGVMRTCVWMYLFKNYSIKDWIVFSEVYGQPIRIGKYDPSTGSDEREALELAIAMIGSDAAGIISRDTEIEIIEAVKSTSVDVYDRLIEFCEATQSKAVLGQTLTSSEGQHGTQALGNVHEEVRQDLKKADAKAIAKTLRMQLIRPWVVFNYGAEYADRAPRPVPQISDPEDLEATSRVVKTLREAGLKIPVAWVQEKFSIPAPGDEEPYLEEAVDNKLYQYHLMFGIPTVNEVRARLGLPATAGGNKPTSLPQGATPNGAALASLAAGDPRPGREELLTGTLYADALADAGREAVNDEAVAKVRQVVAAVEEAGSLEEVKEKLAALYGTMPRAQTTRVLEAALTLAELAGRFSAQSDTS